MKELSLRSLRTNPPQNVPLLHVTGQILLSGDEQLTPQIISILENADLPFVVVPDGGETQDIVRSQLTYTRLSTLELEHGLTMPCSIYDNHDRLLLEAGTPITENFCASLESRGIKNLLIRKEIPVELRVEAHNLRKAIKATFAKPVLTAALGFHESRAILEKVTMPLASIDDFSPQKLQTRINKLTEVDFKPKGDPFSKMIRDTRTTRVSENDKEHLSGLTQECLQMSQDIYDWFSSIQMKSMTEQPPIGTINRLVSSILAGVIQHKDIMGLCTINAESPDYLPAHSLAVAVVSCLTGMNMHLGVPQIKSLLYGAILADVGMVRIPKIIIVKRTALDESERAQIKRHPSIGLEMIAHLRELPEEVPWIVYQSHERCDGSGYPGGKKSPQIHMLAKIVGLADVYVAMCTTRPHRPAFLPYKAMEALLQMAARQEFDIDIVKMFLAAQSLFPVGSLVQLSDDRIAQVVSTNPEACSRPVIIMISDKEGRIMQNPGERVNLLDHPEMTIVRPLENPRRSRTKEQLSGF